MKKLIFFCAFCVCTSKILAQTETFDLTTYSPPKGWKKEAAESGLQFKKEDAAKGTYCIITLYKAVPGTANSKENFDLAWASIVKEMVTVSAAPAMQPVASENGWETQSGYAPFESDGNKGIVILVTSSSFQKMVNLIILTNTDVYEKEMTGFLGSLSLRRLEATTIQTPVADNNTAPILGTWGANASDNSDYRIKNGIMNYISRQYTFNANGTYIFVSKAFDPLMNNILLGKENGTYQISGNNITINPKKSVLEAWSKKDGADKWGKLLSSQNRIVEKTTYQFTKHYFSGIQLWNLVLQAGQATQRDGPYSTNTTFTNAWYYAPISANNTAIELPGGQQITTEELKKEPVQQTATNANEPLIGSWGKSNSVSQLYNRNGTYSYNKQQYTFKANGTYTFLGKNYSEDYNETILIKESGTYSINGDKLNVVPKTSVIESWSKKNGADNWGQLKSSQKRVLEKATYQVKMEGKNLILSISKETTRDGRFSNGNYYSYGPPETFTAIKLPN